MTMPRSRVGLCVRPVLALPLFLAAPAIAAQSPEPPAATIPVDPAQPESTTATELDAITVTGSRIKRLDFETAQPVFVIDRQDIERSGATSLGELLQDMTIAGSASNNSVLNSEMGTVEVDLRNLGSQRVLVLVNGRRWVGGMYYYSTGSVDLSTIPLRAIERIEVLKDGASAIYGSDAIAGVVNIVTRRDAAGGELRSQAGQYLAEGDGLRGDVGASWAGNLGGTSVFLDLDYGHEEGLSNAARALTRFTRFGVGPTRGTPFTPRGTLLFSPTPENGDLLGTELCPGDPGSQFCNMILRHGETITGEAGENTAAVADRYEPFDSSSLDESINDLYDPNPDFPLFVGSQRASLFGTLSRRLGSDVQLSGEFLYLRRTLDLDVPFFTLLGDLFPTPFSDIYVAADNPYNPFDQDVGRADAQGYGAGVVLRTLSEAMPLTVETVVETYRAGIGVDGEFDWLARTFQWQTGLVYAESRNPRASGLRQILDHTALALGPGADCEAAPDCVPLNILGGPGSITRPMLDYITYDSNYPKEQWLGNAHVSIANDIFELPAGVVKAAYGIEYRKESYADQPDALIVACRSGCFDATSGSFDVREGFAELGVPLMTNRPLASALDLSVAARHSRYDTFGADTNYKLGLRWKPVDSALLRATASTAFRAPAISDLYLTSAELTFEGLVDPCSDYAGQQGGTPAEPEVQDNCRGAGVPESYLQGPTTPVRDGGNPLLGPESARIFTSGIVYSPSFMPDLNLYLDWYRFELEDSITLLAPQAILDSCYQAPGASETCSLVERDPETGAITSLRYQPLNVGENEIEGVDAGLDFVLPWLRELGQFKFALDSAYLAENVLLIRSGNNQQVTPRQGTATPTNAFPRWKANAELEWAHGSWAVSWRTRYIHRQIESCDDGIVPTLTELGRCSRPDPVDHSRSLNERQAVIYHDVQVGLGFPAQQTRLVVGARNLFDRDPPPSYVNLYNAFDFSTYDLPGRFAYVRASVTF